MQCPKCGTENLETASECGKCGEALLAESGRGGLERSQLGGDTMAPRRGIPLWVLLVALAGLALAFTAGPRLLRRESGPHPVCLPNVKNLSLAVQMYLADHDGVFPPAAQWSDTLLEYVKNEDEYRCPQAGELRCAYAHNAALSMAMYDAVAHATETVVIFESDQGWNAAGGRELLPDEPRHSGGDNYGFADGHAKWVGREEAMSGQAGLRWEVE